MSLSCHTAYMRLLYLIKIPQRFLILQVFLILGIYSCYQADPIVAFPLDGFFFFFSIVAGTAAEPLPKGDVKTRRSWNTGCCSSGSGGEKKSWNASKIQKSIGNNGFQRCCCHIVSERPLIQSYSFQRFTATCLAAGLPVIGVALPERTKMTLCHFFL